MFEDLNVGDALIYQGDAKAFTSSFLRKKGEERGGKYLLPYYNADMDRWEDRACSAGARMVFSRIWTGRHRKNGAPLPDLFMLKDPANPGWEVGLLLEDLDLKFRKSSLSKRQSSSPIVRAPGEITTSHELFGAF